MKQDLLIIFTKNLLYGKVKTRLAATIGNDNAFRIYKNLVAYTYSVTKQLQCDKIVYYSDYTEEDDIWNDYMKATQQGNDLGERMMNAFEDAFTDGNAKAVIIGTDCFEIDQKIIEQAFATLNKNDIVIGPATDGGYYLLGMKSLHPSLFENIAWSTETVFNTTITVCNHLNLSYFLLTVLNDVDEEKDLKRMN